VSRFVLISFSLLSIFARSTCGQDHRAGTISFEPYSLKTFDQQEHPAELGKLWVAENRSKNNGRLIQLAFVRLKTTAANPQPPIVFLAGGPGVPGTGIGRVPVYFHLFARLQEVADVILLDQRGTGLSTPNLQCPPGKGLAPDTWEAKEKATQALVELVRACAEHWRVQGVDLAAFNTNASADDLEDLRRALGAENISLLGHSYGTELALAAVRRHGEHLHRLVLASVQGPDDDVKLPVLTEFGLRRLSRLVAEDSEVNHDVPDLTGSLKQALTRLEQQPVAIPYTDPSTGKSVTLRGGKFVLQLLVEMRFKDGRSVPVLPALVATVARGDYSLFAPLVARLHQGFSNLSIMQFPMTCSDGASIERRTLVSRQTAQTVLGDPSDLALDPKLCAEVGNPDLGPEFRSPVWSTVPTLFLSGSMDSETPPSNAENVRWGFPNSVHIIVENGFHETLPASEVQDIVVDFFKGQDVSGRRVTFARPVFLNLEQAKAQILAPSNPR
jgi:pimeloyl-ACP methyl ester carboxylesterase